MPDTVETYTHRIGRTGRADQKGKAYTFVGQEDKKMVSLFGKNLGMKIKLLTLPISDSNLEAGRHIHKRQSPAGRNGKWKCLWSKSLAVA